MISTDCRKCAKSDYCYVDDVKPCIGYEPKKLTNADKIRSMTDEELAEWASIREMCFIYHLLINDPDLRNKCRIYENCKDCWLEWLKQEAADGT